MVSKETIPFREQIDTKPCTYIVKIGKKLGVDSSSNFFGLSILVGIVILERSIKYNGVPP